MPYVSIEPLPVREIPNPLDTPGGQPLTRLPDSIMEGGGEEDASADFTLSPEELAKLLKELENIKTGKSQGDAATNGMYISGLDHVASDGSIHPSSDGYECIHGRRRIVVIRERRRDEG